ncbi:hypothetical protein FB45DRAFT_1079041 [Roridomyces roridus]|uniref:F-box domain-containing protein n=1 Tax=Roridomyces roridus TaxID=1738132 RepID=A0AAD7CKV7_9AGAR|nr:hypothetical protein FB45DRAFT_1079041 [Roridomyces roridus]
MEGLPDELLDRICSFMDRDELCTTMHISSSFRRVASAYLLFQLGISQSDVLAGTVELVISKSLHLILFVAHICPIQRLECFGVSKNMQLSELERLTAILGDARPIPDLVIHDKLEEGQRRDLDSLPLHLLTHLPQTATDTLLIVVPHSIPISSTSIHVSGPRAGPPPIGMVPLDDPDDPEPTTPDGTSGILMLVFGVILLCLVLALYNLYMIIRCVFLRGFLRRGWSVQERISTDVYPERLRDREGLRLQRLPNQYTLVTCKESGAFNHFFMRPLCGVPESVYSAFLASLDPQFKDATVEPWSYLTFADLATFVSRQNNLRTLDCGHNSISYSSLMSASPFQYHVHCKITHLAAQASYIPNLLSLTLNVERLYLRFPSVSNRLSGPWIFNFFAYCTALEAIARLPGSHSLALSFNFNLAAAYLPWDIEDGSDVPQPETQLHRVEHIMLRRTQAKHYSQHIFTASTIRALLPWLARFPSLQRVSFDKDSVEMMCYDQRLEVAEEIASICLGMSGAGDVAFEIAKDDEIRNG